MATALNQELWLNDFAKVLTRTNTFYSGAKNDSKEVRAAGNIVVPNTANTTATQTVTGGTTLPLTAVKATATFLEYAPVTFARAPKFVHLVDGAEYSFDFFKETMDEEVRLLQESIDYKIAYEWTTDAAGSIVPTTGAARANVFGNASAKAVTFANILKAGTLLSRQNVPLRGRRLLVTPTMMADLVTLPEFIDKDLTGKMATMEGWVGRIAGFDVFETTKLGSFVAAGTKKAIDATDLATDLEAAIAFHPDMVRYGVGTKETGGIGIAINNAPGYLGQELVESWARVGASPSYKENASNIVTGVVTIKEVV